MIVFITYTVCQIDEMECINVVNEPVYVALR